MTPRVTRKSSIVDQEQINKFYEEAKVFDERGFHWTLNKRLADFQLPTRMPSGMPAPDRVITTTI